MFPSVMACSCTCSGDGSRSWLVWLPSCYCISVKYDLSCANLLPTLSTRVVHLVQSAHVKALCATLSRARKMFQSCTGCLLRMVQGCAEVWTWVVAVWQGELSSACYCHSLLGFPFVHSVLSAQRVYCFMGCSVCHALLVFGRLGVAMLRTAFSTVAAVALPPIGSVAPAPAPGTRLSEKYLRDLTGK
jgi:hypothetical protein